MERQGAARQLWQGKCEANLPRLLLSTLYMSTTVTFFLSLMLLSTALEAASMIGKGQLLTLLAATITMTILNLFLNFVVSFPMCWYAWKKQKYILTRAHLTKIFYG